MRPISAAGAFYANISADRNVSGNWNFPDNSADRSVSDDDWFAQACRRLFKHKAGTLLHYITEFDERSCHRYAAGTVQPPARFLRRLLRNQDGFTWLCTIMEDCDAVWWQELQLAIEIMQLVRDRRRNRGHGKPGAPDDP